MLRSLTRVALVATFAAAPLMAQTTRLNGDVTNDGQITATDAQAVLMAAVDLPLLATYDKTYGDADCDGKVTARDAQIILSSVVQLDVSAFCVGKPVGGGVALVTVDFGTGNVVVGGELQLTATPRDSTNKEITGRTATWTTSDAAKATVTSAGIVKGLAVGNVTITATVDGKEGSVPVSVIAATGTTSFTISPSVATVLKDSSVQLAPVVRDAAGNPVSGSTVTWSSSDPAKATVSNTGLVKGLALGNVVITAKTAGFTDATAQVSIVSLAAQANRTWNGSVSTDWSVAGNWTPSGIPIATDTISVPSAPANQPELKAASATVAGIVVAVGAKLNIGANELQVTGRVDVDGEVLGTGKLTIQGVGQSISYVRGKLPSINVNGSTVMVGPVTITGSMEQVAGSIIDMNGFTVKVSKDINIRGALKQTTAASILDVRGNARFFTDAATTQTVLSGGTLRVGGDFVVYVPPAVTTATSPFPSSGTHRVILDGSIKQTVSDTGVTTVTFQELLIQNTSGGVEFKTDLATRRFYVTTRLTGSTGIPITGAGRVVVGTHFTSAAGGSVTLRNLSVGGILTAGADFKPDTLTWIGSSQTVPAGAAYQYQNVVAAGSASLTGTTSFAGGLALGCITTAAGCSSSGTLDVAGKKLTVAKNLQQVANASGSLYMKTSTDSVVVLGGLLGRLTAPDTSEFDVLPGTWLHGWLRVGGDLRVKGSGPGGAAGATHNVILDGAVQQKLQSRSGFNFHHLTIADSLGVVMNDTTAVRSRIVTVAADLNITTAVKLTGTGRMDVAGNVQTTTGSGVEISAISIGSILRASGAFTPDTAEFTSTSVVQTIQNLPAYNNVHVKGKAIFGGSMTFAGSLIVAPGAELNVEARHVQVTKRLIVNGLLRMQDGRDTLSALGDSAIFSGTVENNKAYATAGVLRVSGGLRMDSSSFYPTGSHKVMLIGDVARGVRGGFQDLEIAGNAAITMQNVVVRGSLSGSTPATVVFDTVLVEGLASFAQAANITVKLAAPATAVTSTIKGDLLGAQTMAIVADGKLHVEGKLASTGALTATGATGGLLGVGGDLTFGAGSAITSKRVAVKGTIGSADGMTPDTLVLYGAGTLPAGTTYKTLFLSGQLVLGGNVSTTKLVVNCQSTTGMVTTCNTDATRPSLDLNGKVMLVSGTMEQTGKVLMSRAADTLNVRGNFTINRPYGRTYTNGVLIVGGNLISSQQTTTGDTAVAFAVRNTDGSYAKGTKVVLDGSRFTYQQVTGLDAEFIMSDVDVVNLGGTSGAVRFGSQTGGPTKMTILGNMTVGRLELYNATMSLVVNGDLALRDSALLNGNVIYKGGYSEGLGASGTARHAKLKTIRWLTQPSNRVAGQNFTPDLQVEAVDSTDTRLVGQVPIALTLNGKVVRVVTQSGLATLAATAPTVAGTLTIPATTYVPGNASPVTVNSASFTVSAAAGTHVRFAAQPKYYAVAGTNLVTTANSSLIVRGTDAYGNLVSTTTGAVTVASVASPDTLYGTKTGTLSGGSATLAAMQARKAGIYKIAPAVTGLTSVETDTFRIVHANPAKMVITQQPANAQSGHVMPVGAVFSLYDPYDNLTDNLGTTPTVTITLTRISGTGTATPGINFTSVHNKGVVTITSFNVSGVTSPTVYTATITVTNWAGTTATTSQFTISP